MEAARQSIALYTLYAITAAAVLEKEQKGKGAWHGGVRTLCYVYYSTFHLKIFNIAINRKMMNNS